MLLEQIEEKLKEIDPNVYYGAAWRHDEPIWNYIVFNRKNIKYSTNKTSDSNYIEVHIVRENYVPEDIDIEVIKKLSELPLKHAGIDSTYSYDKKPNTDTVIEILTITFVRARKTNV